MLLGSRRVVAIERGPGGLRAVLRCHCGTLITWSADGVDGNPPDVADTHAAGAQDPMVMSRSVPSGATAVMVGATKLDT